MKDPFDVLRGELVAAAGRVTLSEPSRRRRRLSRRVLVNALGGTAAVAAALGVALVVLLAGGHRHASLMTASSVPPAARPLVRILGVLRRPQTAADRAVEPLVRAPDSILSLVRLAAVTPSGQKVVLVPQRGRQSGTLGLVVFGGQAAGGGTRGIAGGGPTVTPAAIEAGHAIALVPGRKTTLFMVVPDGVARVSFVLTPRLRSGWTAYAPVRSSTVAVPVHNNVAFVQYCCGEAQAAGWYAANGRLIKVIGSSSAGSGPHVRGVLRVNGIASAIFGTSPRVVRGVIDSLLGQAGLAYKPTAAQCGLDHSIAWADQTASLNVYFGHSKFLGYQYGDYGSITRPHPPLHGVELATLRGLRIGDTLARGRSLYGHAFTLSAAQGGTWSVRVGGQLIDGYAWGRPRYGDVSWRSVVATIDAGDVGCAALSP